MYAINPNWCLIFLADAIVSLKRCDKIVNSDGVELSEQLPLCRLILLFQDQSNDLLIAECKRCSAQVSQEVGLVQQSCR